jgi:eukaryotic-like serine/threonine-protein kinase
MDEPRPGRAPSLRRQPPDAGAAAPVVDGLAMCRPSGPRGGPPWRARESATGHEVLLWPWPDRGSAGLLSDLPEHPHLHPARVLHDTAGAPLLAARVAPNGGLDQLVAHRGRLSPGEVAAVALGVGRALAALHAAGRSHGSVGAAAVLLGPGARPLLDGRALARPAAPGHGIGEDVRALGALLTDLLGGPGRVPAELRTALSAATDPDPRLRPDAADLSRQVVAGVPPEALRLVAGDAQGARRSWVGGGNERTGRAVQVRSRARTHVGSPGRISPRALLWPACAAVGALTLAVLAGTAWARFSGPQPVGGSVSPLPVAAATAAGHRGGAATATLAVSTASWVQVLAELDLRRAAAFASADGTVLAVVDAPGSAALRADQAVVRALTAGDLRVRGYRLGILGVRPLRVAAAEALLSVRDVRSAYQVLAGGTLVVASRPARASSDWVVDLVRVGGRWLVRVVLPG